MNNCKLIHLTTQVTEPNFLKGKLPKLTQAETDSLSRPKSN